MMKRHAVNGQVEVPAGGQLKVPTPCGCSALVLVSSLGGSGFAHPVGLSAGDHGGGVVQEPVQQADGGGVFGEESAPVFEGPVRGDGQGPAFVGGCDEAEEQLGAGVVQRSEAHFVEYEEVVAQQRVDGLAD